MIELLINGTNALTMGIRMGEGFMSALGAAAPMKDYIENSSRLKNGKEVISKDAKVDCRQVTLTFNLEGSFQNDFETKKLAFYSLLYLGEISIKTPLRSSNVYHLVYKNSTSYAENTEGTFCKIAVKFEEPDPTDRI